MMSLSDADTVALLSSYTIPGTFGVDGSVKMGPQHLP
jgi:hypothetical protein